VWRRLAELGLVGLGLPEEAGGLGLPVVEEALVFRVLGRHLAPVGLLASVLAARLAHASGDDSLRKGLVEGEVRAGIALPGDPGYGTDPVVVADLPAGGLLVHDAALRSAASPGSPLASVDPTTTLVAVRLDEMSIPRDVPPGAASEVTALGAVLAAAMLVGSAEACRDLSVSHAATRVQFDRPIGVHQAIKHRCADMAVGCEAASTMLAFASLALRDGRVDAPFHVAAAKRVAGRTALSLAHSTVQVHGGMGFTWEHDAHLHLARARLLDRLAGTPGDQRRALLATAPQIP
jgi:alkylation response protein AidB-like acyl-CoA dehydrogenase